MKNRLSLIGIVVASTFAVATIDTESLDNTNSASSKPSGFAPATTDTESVDSTNSAPSEPTARNLDPGQPETKNASPVLGNPGDIFYVQESTVALRSGPSESSSVVIELKKFHRVMEFQREGAWIEVGADRTGGKSGWLPLSAIGTYTDGRDFTPFDARFETFKNDFERFNIDYERRNGRVLFTSPKNMADGIITIQATNSWLQLGARKRSRELSKVFKMWKSAEGTGSPVFVNVVDKNGNILDSKSSL